MKKHLSLSLALIFCIMISGCTSQTPSDTLSTNSMTPSGSSSNDAAQTPSSPDISGSISSPDSTSGYSENEKIEAAIHNYNQAGRGRPSFGYENSGRMFVDFDGPKVYIPNLDINYVCLHPSDYDLLNDSFVIAYFSGNSNSISFLSTTDKGKSWQSSELNVENADNYYWHLAFQNAEKGFLVLDSKEDYGSGCMIFITEDFGKTWTQAGSISGSDVTGIRKTAAAGGHYWIVGRKKPYPVMLKSDDGTDWREVQISIDTTKYIGGFCRAVSIYDDIGLAEVVGETADGKSEAMWYSSEDRGETWSFYRAYL